MKHRLHPRIERHRCQPPSLWSSYIALQILLYALALILITPWFIWSCRDQGRTTLATILTISWIVSITVTLLAVARRNMDRISATLLALAGVVMLALCGFVLVTPPHLSHRPTPASVAAPPRH